MESKAFFEALERVVGQPFHADDLESCGFTYKEYQIMICWIDAARQFFVYVELVNSGGYRRDRVCARVLELNYLLGETNGAALSLDPETKKIGLNMLIPVYGLEPSAFLRIIDTLLITADSLVQQIHQIKEEEKEKALGTLDAEHPDSLQTFQSSSEKSTPSAMLTFLKV